MALHKSIQIIIITLLAAVVKSYRLAGWQHVCVATSNRHRHHHCEQQQVRDRWRPYHREDQPISENHLHAVEQIVGSRRRRTRQDRISRASVSCDRWMLVNACSCSSPERPRPVPTPTKCTTTRPHRRRRRDERRQTRCGWAGWRAGTCILQWGERVLATASAVTSSILSTDSHAFTATAFAADAIVT